MKDCNQISHNILSKKIENNNNNNNIISITQMNENNNLLNMSKPNLLLKCKEFGITNYSSKNKTELIKLIKDKEESKTEIKPEINKKKIVSLFAGCGGLDYGFINNNKYTHVLVNEYDKDACMTYENNFKIKTICCDIKVLNDIPDCDLLIGGFPCQGFSMVNPYRSEHDSRNELYLEIIRILKLKKTSYFLLENVKGILNMGGYATNEDKKNQTGKIMKIILDDLEKCGYNVIFKLFDIKKYNVPQKRERVIFIGVRNDIIFEPKIPECSDKIITLKDAIGDLPINYDSKNQHIGTKHKCKITGFVGNRELNWDEPSPTITGRGGGNGGPVIHNHPSLKRRLTVRECARIQTFPDNFIFYGSISSMYKQIGNAVPCKFSEYLAKIFEDAP